MFSGFCLLILVILVILVIGLQAYAIILPSVLYNLGLCLCIAFHNYFRVINTVGIDAVRAMIWYASVAEDLNMIWFSGAVRRSGHYTTACNFVLTSADTKTTACVDRGHVDADTHNYGLCLVDFVYWFWWYWWYWWYTGQLLIVEWRMVSADCFVCMLDKLLICVRVF